MEEEDRVRGECEADEGRQQRLIKGELESNRNTEAQLILARSSFQRGSIVLRATQVACDLIDNDHTIRPLLFCRWRCPHVDDLVARSSKLPRLLPTQRGTCAGAHRVYGQHRQLLPSYLDKQLLLGIRGRGSEAETRRRGHQLVVCRVDMTGKVRKLDSVTWSPSNYTTQVPT